MGTRKNGHARRRHARGEEAPHPLRVSLARARSLFRPLFPSACYAGYSKGGYVIHRMNMALSAGQLDWPPFLCHSSLDVESESLERNISRPLNVAVKRAEEIRMEAAKKNRLIRNSHSVSASSTSANHICSTRSNTFLARTGLLCYFRSHTERNQRHQGRSHAHFRYRWTSNNPKCQAAIKRQSEKGVAKGKAKRGR